MTAPLFCRASGLGPLFRIFEAEQGAEALKRLRLQTGFRLECPAPSVLVPFVLMNRVFNLAARMSGDRQFGARVGQNIRLEDFGPFVEYALQGETLGQMVARSIAAQPLHSSELVMDLRAEGGRAIWRICYRARCEPTVEHHAQRSLMQMLGGVMRYPGAGKSQIEIHVAEPHAAEARLLESRIGVAVRPRASDYALSFPASWLDKWTPVAGLSAVAPIEELSAYRDRPLPKRIAEAVLLALELHDDRPQNGLGATAAEFGLPRRTLQHALRLEGASYREIVRQSCLRRAKRLLATSDAPLAEIALRAGYTDPSNFHRAFLRLTGMTPGRFRAASQSGAPLD
ncbi:AraC family transcriptional regulator [uncultured Rhodoblastus sp.]|uniref:helix-turn-helix domain-containing protein n=1 Tax=uncultured Rhodoblastus sp. TaxID=543037 RepID=UPI0025E47223|nr:AraC family transcriptional regulator [uncultured Rhodoblastus sp.]